MKKSKKFVLAALVLLAIAGLLALTSCKNDSVPEPPSEADWLQEQTKDTNDNAGTGDSNTNSSGDGSTQPETPKYTVTFDKGDNSEYIDKPPADITVMSGTKLMAEQLKGLTDTDSYIFEYWYDKDDDERKRVGEGYTVTKNVTLVAKWRDRGIAASVIFSPAAGTRFYFDEILEVTLTSEEGTSIWYKLDDGDWTDYTVGSTIPVDTDTTITAYATKEGLKSSAETSATYEVWELSYITVTPPTQTVYSEGDVVDFKKDDKIEATAHYNNGTTRAVEGTITTETSTLTQSAGINKEVSVSYMEGDVTKTVSFTVDVASYKFTETVQEMDSGYVGTVSPASNSAVSDPIYKKFGDWPQTVKEESVEIGTGTLDRGGLTYHVGNDGNYYVEQGGKYYKVEPIVWRVLTENYNSTSNALFLAEKILAAGIKWADNGDTYANNYNNYSESNIRKWLNGNSWRGSLLTDSYVYLSDYSGTPGFLQTAFTEVAQELIEETVVRNGGEEAFGTGETQETNQNACFSTMDRIFLLSMKEVTTESYGFATYNWTDNTRIRVTTDYAKVTGDNSEWLLRSPHHYHGDVVCTITSDGSTDSYTYYVDFTRGGVVPALCVRLD